MSNDDEQSFAPERAARGFETAPGSSRLRRGADPLIGTVLLGEYQIIDLLGEGAMARVYKAMQNSVQRFVAIKTLTSPEPEMVARFENEVKLVSKLKHKNIVQAIDCLVDPTTGQVYFVMEYLAGMTLEHLIKRKEGLMTEDDIASVVGQLCDALSYAQSQGIVHRDLKPANAILLEQDGNIVVKVVDFGIARVEADVQRLTRAGSVVGSPLYMSPEQCMGSDLDSRADIYALGAVMYELITGELPYKELHAMKVMAAHCDPARFPDPIETKVQIKNPNQLNQIIRTAMSTEKEKRFQSAVQFKEALNFWHRSQKDGNADVTIPINLERSPSVAKAAVIMNTAESRSLHELVAWQQQARDPSQKVWRSPELFAPKSEIDERRTISGAHFESLRQNEPLTDKTIFKKYKVMNLIGEGGMAVVYRAQNIETGEMVAIKTLKFNEPELGARFAREVEIHKQLKHPNIVKAIECLEARDGQAFFIMELLTGMVLDDKIVNRGRVQSVEDIGTIYGQILDAIEFAHDKGVIHRDIKLENIILTEQKGQIRVKVLDFGVARIQEDLQRLTKTGVILGSPAYMSPEQCMGQTLDSRSDLYSAGVVAYEMITGVLPIMGTTEIEVMDGHCNPRMVPAPLSSHRNDLPGMEKLDEIFANCLAKDPDQRYQTVTDLKLALHEWWQTCASANTDMSSPFRVSRRRQEERTKTAKLDSVKATMPDLSQELASLVSDKRETEREAFASRFKHARVPGAGMQSLVKPLIICLCIFAAFTMIYFASTAIEHIVKQNKQAATNPQPEIKIEAQTKPSAQSADASQESDASEVGEETPQPRKKKNTGVRVLRTGQFGGH